MADQHWPAQTPRDEMLARVATRGTRLRALRGAVNALAIVSVVGASALGVGAAVSALGGGGGTELETVAMEPERPEGPTSAPAPTDGSPGTGPATSFDAVPSTVPGSSVTTPASDTRSSGSSGGASSGGSNRPGTTRPSPAPPSTGASTTAPPTTVASTTTGPIAPAVGNLRMKADGVPVDLNVCLDEPNSVLSVNIVGADSATVSWNRAGETRTAEMTPGDREWTAAITDIDDQPGDVPLLVTIEATGPGGTTRTSTPIPVVDCSPPTV